MRTGGTAAPRPGLKKPMEGIVGSVAHPLDCLISSDY